MTQNPSCDITHIQHYTIFNPRRNVFRY